MERIHYTHPFFIITRLLSIVVLSTNGSLVNRWAVYTPNVLLTFILMTPGMALVILRVFQRDGSIKSFITQKSS